MDAVHAAAGLLYRDGYILLGKRSLHRASYPGCWDLPGGHCEPGESANETLARELREEIGVVPISATPIATLSVAEGNAQPLEVRVYLVTEWQGNPENLLPDEHEVLAWFTIDEAMTLPLATPVYLDVFRRARHLAE